MNKPRLLLFAAPAVAMLAATAYSVSTGAFPGTVTLMFGAIPLDVSRTVNSCGQCHGPQGALGAEAVMDVPDYVLDLNQSVTLGVRALGGVKTPGKETWGGFLAEVTAGQLTPGTTSHIDPSGKFISHINAFGGGRNWQFTYTGTQAGVVEVWPVINTVNGDGRPSGDLWGFHGPDRFAPDNVPVRLYVNAPGVTDIGAGCDGSYGNRPVLGAKATPSLGNGSFGFELYGASVLAPVTLVVGAPLPAPLPLDGIGITGCSLHVQSATSLAALTGAGNSQAGDGSAVIPLPIPNTSGLQGGVFAVQAAYLDPMNGRSLAVTLTNALSVTIQ